LNLNGGLSDLLSKTRSRHLWNILLHEAIWAVSLALGGLILLLVLGTEILQWYWPVVLFGGGLALGIHRTSKRIPSPYRLLQIVDHRLNLHDGLSTAFYFAQPAPPGRGSERIRAAQQKEAEALSRRLDPRRAVPLEVPRGVYVAVLLAVAAGTLFAARYGIQRTLDLRPPISQALVDFFRFPAQFARSDEAEALPPQPEPVDTAVNRDERRPSRQEQTHDPVRGDQEHEPSGQSRSPESGRPLEETRDADNSAETWEKDSANAPGEQPQAEESSTPPPAPESPPPDADSKPAPPQEESDLIRKMQDAFANLLAKLKIPPMAGEGRRTSDRSASEGGKPEKAEGQKGREPPGSPEGEGTPTADPQGNRANEGAQQAQAGKGEGAEQSSDQPGQEQARSGIGAKDGAKDLKAQEQLEAMGKLSEILGKRAENITGEVMIEVSSGDQSLHTPYAERSATHREAGGQIHRDEVPLVYHEYVQRYFEQVRKPATK
jgi:hypothetical protein